MAEGPNFPTVTLKQRLEEASNQSDLTGRTQTLSADLQVEDAIIRLDDYARKATRERLDEMYAIHTKRGLIGTGATPLVLVAVFEDEAKSFIINLVREVSAQTRSAQAFDRIQEVVERFLSLFEGELERIVTKIDDVIQDRAKAREFSEAAEMLWAEKRAGLHEMLQLRRSEYAEPSEKLSEGLEPRQTCMLCSHWEPMSDAPKCNAGLCRRLALGPSNAGWSITEANDGCDEWAGEGFYKGKDGTIRADRRTFVRTRVDHPARLCTPGREWSGRLVDISERGAQLRMVNPPREGATALLKWDSHESFCDVIWANEGACGVKFEMPLPRAVLLKATGASDKTATPVADQRQIPPGKKRVTCKFQFSTPGNQTRSTS